MKISILAKVCPLHQQLGGMGHAIVGHSNMIRGLGHDVSIVTTKVPGYPKVFEHDGMTIFNIDGVPKTYNGEFYRGTRDAINKIYPDLIIVHSDAGRGIIDFPIPKIFHEHGHGYQSVIEYMMQHYLMERTSREIFRENILKKMDVLWGASRRSLEKYDACVFLTALSSMEVQQRMLIQNVVCIPPVVNETDTGDQEKKYDICVCANKMFLGNKGTDYAIKALSSTGISGVFVGHPPKSCDYPNIKTAGYVEKTEVYKLMKMSKVVLELSFHQTGLNMVKLESLYNGVGIIGWNVGSSYETIEDGVNGYIVKLGDMNELIKKIRLSISQHKKIGAGSKRIYEDRFSNKYIAGKWEELIEEVISHG